MFKPKAFTLQHDEGSAFRAATKLATSKAATMSDFIKVRIRYNLLSRLPLAVA